MHTIIPMQIYHTDYFTIILVKLSIILKYNDSILAHRINKTDVQPKHRLEERVTA